MKKSLLAATAVVALTAGAASAQSVTEVFDSLIYETLDLEGVGSPFAGIAVNLGDIDSSITIDAGDLAGGELSFSDLDVLIDAGTSSSEGSSTEGGAEQLSTLDAVIEASTTEVEVKVNASTNVFGDVSTVAAGAINTYTADLTETGATVASSADAATTSTSAAAEFASTTGEGVGAMTLSANLADINAAIDVNLGSGNNSFTSIGTVGAGAINTSNITAVFVGGAGSGNVASVD